MDKDVAAILYNDTGYAGTVLCKNCVFSFAAYEGTIGFKMHS